MRWMILFIVVCSLAVSTRAHAVHGGIVCSSCHVQFGAEPARTDRAGGCAVCHTGYDRIFTSPMVHRTGEKQFIQRSFARVDSEFWNKNCDSCHLKSCLDCHDKVLPSKPSVASCQKCHKGYYTGWDFSGRAPREDNMRYQRGIAVNGETFLKMTPDVHYLAGMTCGDCHSMASLIQGRKSSKKCLDCHIPSQTPVEHRIAAHLQRLECSACHSAWGAQEYGSFFLRFRDQKLKEEFDLTSGPSPEYLRSAYLKSQDAPPLGLNAAGKISPVRPHFIAYYTDILTARNGGPENVLLAAEWRAYFPHTIQRGTVTCEGCHDSPRRFVHEPENQRIHQLKKDGMVLESFWVQKGQRVMNGNFVSADRYNALSTKTPTYKKAYVEKWKSFLNHVENSSRP